MSESCVDQKYRGLDSSSVGQQMRAVHGNGNLIRFIRDPCELVQRTAINCQPYAIIHITNPARSIQVKVLAMHINVLTVIGRPDHDVVLDALERRWTKDRYDYVVTHYDSSDGFIRKLNLLKLKMGPL